VPKLFDSPAATKASASLHHPDHDVVIVGAGPYGLSAAAYLSTIKNLRVRVFGEPMAFWQQAMPAGMFLRSNWTATQIASPGESLALETYQGETNDRFSTPVPIAGFVGYGRWYQQHGVPNIDARKVTLIEPCEAAFRLTLSDGKAVTAARVIVAAGIGAFAWRPPEFQHLPADLATHTSEHSDLRCLAGKRVLIVGGGQSALESAALLNEAGAEVEVICRQGRIHWLQGLASRTLHHHMGELTRRLLYAPTDVGPAVLSQLVARPQLLRPLPRALQEKLRRRCVRPAGARWLVHRLQNVPILLGHAVSSAQDEGGRVKVRVDDGSERMVDHVLLGTGYRVDIARYGFLSPNLLQSIKRDCGYPRLGIGLESSVAGLHFLGAPAARAFGPLMQFVSGTRYASPALLSCVHRQLA
jgi:FAD-dependent urate hydroxylase